MFLVYSVLLSLLAGFHSLSFAADLVMADKSASGIEIMAPPVTDSRFGKDSAECVRHWSMYDEFFKHGAYDYAFEPWKYVLDNCPLVAQNVYVHGVTIVRYMFDNETDPARKKELLDLMMRVFDQRIQYFENEGYVLGRKAGTLYQLDPGNMQELFNLTERSISLMGDNTEPAVLQLNLFSAIGLMQAGQLQMENLFENYLRALEIIENNLYQQANDRGQYQNTLASLEQMIKPFATCSNLVGVFTPRFESSPGDIKLLKRITSLLDNSGCGNDELFFRAIEKLHSLSPDANNAFLLGRMESNRGNFERAIRYFQEAANGINNGNGEANRDQAFRSYLLMSEISYRQLRQLSQARDYARKAHDARNTDGRPMLLIGEMYAASAPDCGSDEFLKKTAYWAAIDKFLAALNATEEPAIKERAQLMIDTYRQYFPTREEIFFNGYTPGNTFRVECWINENTVIRAR